MNIWEWVFRAEADLRRDGHHRLAEIIDRLPGQTIAGNKLEVDAMAGEGIGLARSLRMPWVEVFVRHWWLQLRVIDDRQGEAALPFAVDALDRAHQDDARGCPQAVCTVQDLAICYSNVDGVGWAEERLAVAEEALSSIAPDWSCWSCLTAERASALVDLGRADEAVAQMDRARVEIGLVGDDVTTIAPRMTALIAAGRPEDALRAGAGYLAASTSRQRDDAPKRTTVHLRRARAFLDLGRDDDAVAAFAECGDLDRAHFENWARVIEELCRRGRHDNDAALGELRVMAESLVSVGSWRPAATVALCHGRLASGRGRRWVAEHAVALAADAVARLRAPAPLDAQLAELTAAVDALPRAAVDVGDDPAALLERLWGQEAPDPEADLDVLDAAARAWPDEGGLVAQLATALLASGHHTTAVELLDDFVTAHPGEHDATHILCDIRLDEGDDATVTALAERLRPVSPAVALWLLARHAAARARWDVCADHCHALLEVEADARNTRRLLSHALRELQRFDEATDALLDLQTLAGADEWDDSDDWDLTLAATAAGRWDVVRAAAARLGMAVGDGEGAIDEEWHAFVLRYEDGTEVLCGRTGPVTAKVISVPLPHLPVSYGDRVLFRPTPLEEIPERDEDDDEDAPLPVFAFFDDQERSGYERFPVDAVDPGDEAVVAFRESLTERGFPLWIYGGGGGYTVFDDSGDEADGFYAMVAVPPGVRAAEVDAVLSELTEEWPRPVAWPELAVATGDEARITAHEAASNALHRDHQDEPDDDD